MDYSRKIENEYLRRIHASSNDKEFQFNIEMLDKMVSKNGREFIQNASGNSTIQELFKEIQSKVETSGDQRLKGAWQHFKTTQIPQGFFQSRVPTQLSSSSEPREISAPEEEAQRGAASREREKIGERGPVLENSPSGKLTTEYKEKRTSELEASDPKQSRPRARIGAPPRPDERVNLRSSDPQPGILTVSVGPISPPPARKPPPTPTEKSQAKLGQVLGASREDIEGSESGSRVERRKEESSASSASSTRTREDSGKGSSIIGKLPRLRTDSKTKDKPLQISNLTPEVTDAELEKIQSNEDILNAIYNENLLVSDEIAQFGYSNPELLVYVFEESLNRLDSLPLDSLPQEQKQKKQKQQKQQKALVQFTLKLLASNPIDVFNYMSLRDRQQIKNGLIQIAELKFIRQSERNQILKAVSDFLKTENPEVFAPKFQGANLPPAELEEAQKINQEYAREFEGEIQAFGTAVNECKVVFAEDGPIETKQAALNKALQASKFVLKHREALDNFGIQWSTESDKIFKKAAEDLKQFRIQFTETVNSRQFAYQLHGKSGKEIFEDLNTYTLHLFKEIDFNELPISSAFPKVPQSITAPSLQRMAQATEGISNLVAKSILDSKDADERNATANQVAKAAKKALKEGNYFLSQALFLGLINDSVSKSAQLSKKKQVLVDKYRDGKEAAKEQDARQKEGTVLIPSLTMLGNSFVRLIEMNPERLDRGVFNLSILQLTHRMLYPVLKAQEKSKSVTVQTNDLLDSTIQIASNFDNNIGFYNIYKSKIKK